MRYRIILTLLTGFTSVFVYAQVYQPDLGNGKYKNPIIHADYSDPDVVRVGDDFFMVASSFNCVPGLPLLHSKDLVNWSIINNVIQKLEPAEAFDQPQHGNGVWAPSIRYHAGWYYVFYGDPDYGIYMCRTRNPWGEWEPPHLVRAAKGWIDACPFWDDDGNAYLVHAFAGSRAAIKSILVLHKMSIDGTVLLDDGVLVFDGHKDHPTIEGPKMYKRNGYYYIFAPGGGVEFGWQTVLRSRNIYGPYEDKIVLSQNDTDINGPHQGAWIDTPNGESWFVHFQDKRAYGRITHLQPAEWKN
ncbi:MAG: glycoside hydrolase 43 family protein, partial [Lewinella sp.]|nr:glycoside hydrolase 43 family protein [Lewinella sp.]